MFITPTQVTKRPLDSGASKSNHLHINISTYSFSLPIYSFILCILLKTSSCFVSLKQLFNYYLILGSTYTHFACFRYILSFFSI
ncbi:hypothetical protein BDQ17DRAFT_365781 [Cyathus striatus]|nr:hypothetical protein BDQ17DRAFT_365781 [Cyathus striatus]